MVYYRKYRPQTIDELDNGDVRRTLHALFERDSIPHAFLFTGSKGLGKTSTARIVAKVINCTNRKKDSVEPCNKCDMCVSITNGSNLDVMEIDGASNRGIDEIRDLREKIKLSPLSAKRKVYIIDEVHMLTTEAFNALLKTLEEPPAHAVFILCTTEPHKVPDTIRSRCFHITFTKATAEELVRSLSRIAKGEGLSVEKDAFDYIAKLSDGAFRDGAKILEEIALAAGKDKITKELAEKNFKTTNIDLSVVAIVRNLEEKNAAKAFEEISKLTSSGASMSFLIEEMIQHLHKELLNQVSGKKEYDFTLDELKDLIELLNTAHAQLKFAVVPQLPLELLVVDWTNRGQEAGIKNQESGKKQEEPKDVKRTVQAKVQTSDLWRNFIDEVKKENNLIAGVLRSCSLGEQADSALTIETKFKFHKEKLDGALAVLEQAAERLTGKKMKVAVQLAD